MTFEEIQAKIDKRRAEIRRKEELERRKEAFNKMPIAKRKAFEAVGWSPYQDGQPIRRICGTFTTK